MGSISLPWSCQPTSCTILVPKQPAILYREPLRVSCTWLPKFLEPAHKDRVNTQERGQQWSHSLDTMIVYNCVPVVFPSSCSLMVCMCRFHRQSDGGSIRGIWMSLQGRQGGNTRCLKVLFCCPFYTPTLLSPPSFFFLCCMEQFHLPRNYLFNH